MKYKWDIIKLLKLTKNEEYGATAKYALAKYFKVPDEKLCEFVPYQNIFEYNAKYLEDNIYLKEYSENLNKYRSQILKGIIKENDKNNIFINLTPDDVLYIVNDFFESLSFDEEIYNAYKKVYNQRFDHLKFNKEICDENVLGMTYYCGPDDVYIDLYHTGNDTEVYNLVHEYGHAIAHILHKNNSKGYENFHEMESYFFQMLFTKYLISKPGSLAYNYPNILQNAKYNGFELLETNCYFNDKLSKKMKLIEYENYFANYPDDIDLASLERNIALGENLDIELVESYFDYDYTQTSIYPVGLMISTELVNLYDFDKVKALELYKDFISHECETPLEHIDYIKKQGINPCQNFDSYVRKLER